MNLVCGISFQKIYKFTHLGVIFLNVKYLKLPIVKCYESLCKVSGIDGLNQLSNRLLTVTDLQLHYK